MTNKDIHSLAKVIEKKSLSHEIANSTESNLVGIIGHTVILFRQNPNAMNQNYKF